MSSDAGQSAEIDGGHFWHPDLLHELHPGAGTLGTDDLRRVTCVVCRVALIEATRASQRARLIGGAIRPASMEGADRG